MTPAYIPKTAEPAVLGVLLLHPAAPLQVFVGGTPYKIGDTVTMPIGNTSVVYVITDANGAQANDTTSVLVVSNLYVV